MTAEDLGFHQAWIGRASSAEDLGFHQAWIGRASSAEDLSFHQAWIGRASSAAENSALHISNFSLHTALFFFFLFPNTFEP